jgi:RND family efflux transporter MFP subunit
MHGCSADSAGGQGKGGQKLVPAVEAVQAKYGSLPLTERINGLVKAKNQVELYPQISAQIMQVFVQNGDLVKQGEALVRLRDTDLKEKLNQALASLQIAIAQAKQAEAENDRALTELKRSTALKEKNLISPTEFEDISTKGVSAEADAELARARVQQAEANVNEQKEALSQTIVRAPVDGTVGNRNAEVGMVVTPNTKLFTLGQLDSLRIEVVLTDKMLTYIKEKQRTEIFSSSIPYGSLEAPLARISPFLHPLSHSTKAEIDLANSNRALKPGMFVGVDIFYGESEQATLVPLSSLWEDPATATTGVYVCQDSLTQEPIATIDDPRGGGLTNEVPFLFVPVEVIAKGRLSAGVRGIDPNSWIVTIGQDLLSEESPRAKVRMVKWERVEQQQLLQREDLIDELLKKQEKNVLDTNLTQTVQPANEVHS